MKFGVREIANVVFKAKSDVTIGSTKFVKGQPVLYIDSAKTSTIEGAATTVYATGGRGNTRLIAWEGEKTLTFTVEDALLSPIGFSILSGAGLLKGASTEEVHVHVTANAYADNKGIINIADSLEADEQICATAPIFVMKADADGSIIAGTPLKLSEAKSEKNGDVYKHTMTLEGTGDDYTGYTGKVLVYFEVVKASSTVSELQIDAENFAGYYYVEASTLFRRQNDGVDLPAEITFPNVKIQSNFTFSMASTGDPSTFTFTMDAMPGYTVFNPNKKVLCAIQIVEDSTSKATAGGSVFPHVENHADFNDEDSYNTVG